MDNHLAVGQNPAKNQPQAFQVPASAGAFVLLGAEGGRSAIYADTPLTRLNYFDGKFLKAEDLQLEQSYHRRLVRESSLAGGPGVAFGYDALLSQNGDELVLGPGLAIDPAGRVLLHTTTTPIAIGELIDASRRFVLLQQPQFMQVGPGFEQCQEVMTAPTATLPFGNRELYIVSLVHAEALCGEEDVYGRVCEDACITGTARAQWKEGIAVRVRPLDLRRPLISAGAIVEDDRTHLRSRVAAAYFADEAERVASQIPGLLAGSWCLGADPSGDIDVPVAVIARRGSSTLFMDPWIARRERMEAPARRYWAWRMGMRPWDVFLAQVLQFQCQLISVLGQGGTPVVDDLCGPERRFVIDLEKQLGQLKQSLEGTPFLDPAMYGTLAAAGLVGNKEIPNKFVELIDFHGRAKELLERRESWGPNRILVNRGILELPSAGYLPVDPTSRGSVNAQVTRLMGEGVQLRFCAVRPDYVQHAFEAAQHMERISLIQGLDDPTRKPQVDILVPDGEFRGRAAKLHGFEVDLGFSASDEEKDPEVGEETPVENGGGTETPQGAERAAFSTFQLGGTLAALVGLIASLRRMTALSVSIAGAGRAEAHPAGGGAFHFAGLSGGSTAKGFGALSRGMRKVAIDKKVGIDRESLADFIVATAAMVREEASQVAAERTAGLESIPTRQLEVIASEPLVTAWASMGTRHDPRRMRRTQSTPAGLRVVIGQQATADAEAGIAIDIRLDGRFIVDTPAHSDGDATIVEGRFKGRQSVEITLGGPNDLALQFSLNVHRKVHLAWRAPFLGDRSVTVRFPRPTDPGVFLRVVQPGDTSDVVVQLGGYNPQDDKTVDVAELNRSNAIFNPGNERHMLARDAIRELGELLVEKGFSARARKRLFTTTLFRSRDIFSPRNWVLFRRRRVIDCGVRRRPAPPVAEPPVEVTYRRYHVYLIRIADDAKLQRFRTAILSEGMFSELKAFEPVAITQVRFRAGRPALVSDPARLRDALAAEQPGPTRLYAVLASEGDALGDRRQDRLAQLATVDGTAPFNAKELAVIDPAGGSRLDSGVDGIILLVSDRPGETPPEPKTTTHGFYALEATRAAEVTKRLSEEGPSPSVLKELIPLGDVEFGATAAMDEADFQGVLDKWKQFRPTLPPTSFTTIARAGTESTQRGTEARAVGDRLATEVLPTGATPPGMMDSVHALGPNQEMPPVVAAVTVFGVTDPQHRFYAAAAEQVEVLRKALPHGGPSSGLLGALTSLGGVAFNQGVPVASMLPPVLSAWTSFRPGVTPLLLIVSAPPGQAADREQEARLVQKEIAQAVAAGGAAATTGAPLQVEHIAPPAGFVFPSHTTSVTILLPVESAVHRVAAAAKGAGADIRVRFTDTTQTVEAIMADLVRGQLVQPLADVTVEDGTIVSGMTGATGALEKYRAFAATAGVSPPDSATVLAPAASRTKREDEALLVIRAVAEGMGVQAPAPATTDGVDFDPGTQADAWTILVSD